MKKILVFLLIFISLKSAAQTHYNPLNGSLSNKPYAPAQAVPTDMRSYFYDSVNHIFRAYQSTAEVLSYLNLSKYRAGNFPIYVHSGGVLNGDGTYTGGNIAQWWFKDGTADGNLVLFSSGSGGSFSELGTSQPVYFKDDSTIGSHAIDSLRNNAGVLQAYKDSAWIPQFTLPTFTNTNVGSGYRWAVPGTNNIKTHVPGLGLIDDSTSNANAITSKIDTAYLNTLYSNNGTDTSFTGVTIDSTGQPQNRILIGIGNNHIGSYTKLITDSSKSKVVIGNKNISYGGSAKLAVKGNVFADNYIVNGGTSSQFLKADGSLDANTYLTTAVSSVAMTGDNVIYNTSVTGSPITTSGTLVPVLKTQSAYTLFGRASGSGTPSFLASIDSNWIPTLHSASYYAGLYVPYTGGTFPSGAITDSILTERNSDGLIRKIPYSAFNTTLQNAYLNSVSSHDNPTINGHGSGSLHFDSTYFFGAKTAAFLGTSSTFGVSPNVDYFTIANPNDPNTYSSYFNLSEGQFILGNNTILDTTATMVSPNPEDVHFALTTTRSESSVLEQRFGLNTIGSFYDRHVNGIGAYDSSYYFPTTFPSANNQTILSHSNGDGTYSTLWGNSTATTTNALTFNNSGSGDASGTSFNGSVARTLSYNSIGAVPTSRTITINGTAFDLSANRSWSVGTLTNLTATNNYAQTWTITNPTTTPNLSLVLDTTKFETRLYGASQYQPLGTYVTSVSGTTLQIASTGGTTPVLSLVSGGTLPGAWALGTVASATLTNATGLPISTGLTGGTTNRIPYFTSATALSTSSAFLFDGNNLGVGATPDALLTVSKQTTIVAPVSGSLVHYIGLDANPLRITYDTHNNASASGTALMFRRSRGTAGTPLAVSSGDDLGSFNTRGYGTTGYAASSTGLLSFKANQTFTDANMGTYAAIYTTPDNSVTAAEALRITGAGVVNAIQSGGKYQINSTDVLTSTTLGSGITASSLTSFGASPTLITPTIGVASGTALSLTGTGGNGYLSLATQSSDPAAPAGGTVIFSNSNSKLSWRGSANNFVKTFDGSAATANRIYSLPDAAGTVDLTDNIATLMNKSINASEINSGTLPTAQTAALTGDVTKSAGSNATTIANSAVTQAKTANYTAYTIWGNNTSGAAAPTDATFEDKGQQTYSGTITWDGTAPTTIAAQTYRWTQVGKIVTLRMSVSYTNAGITNITATLTFPSDCPAPEEPTGFTATNDILYMGTGIIGTGTSASANNGRCWIYKTGTGTYNIKVSTNSQSAKTIWVNITYFIP